jgi:hypothetical protein
MNTIKDLISTPHPVFQRYFNFWNFLQDSYEGGIDYTQSRVETAVTEGVEVRIGGKVLPSMSKCNMFKHPKERDVDYRERVKQSYYYNFCAPNIDIYTNHLFKQSVDIDFEGIDDRTIEAVSDNIDRMGSSIVEFRKHMAELAQVFGHVFVLCDKPNVDTSGIITLKDQMDAGLYPYLVLYKPQQIINWALDEFGRPYWILVSEDRDINIDPFNIAPGKATSRIYRLWTRNEWFVFDSEFKGMTQGVHGLGIVPIDCVYDKRSIKVRNFLGISTIADISLIARDVYNSCSELKQILRDQTFAILAVQGSADEYNELSVGTSKGLLYPENRAVPTYVSPPPANAEVYFQHIDRQVSKMFQMAKLEGASAAFKGQNAVEQSGVSKAWDFNETNSTLSQKADNLSDGELRIWQMFAKQDGGEFTGTVTYPKEFSIQSLNEDLDEAEKMAKVNLGNEFMIEVKKAIIQKKFPRMPEEKIAEMESGLETAQEQSGVNGNGGMSLKSRLPFLFKPNANSGGKKEGEERNV